MTKAIRNARPVTATLQITTEDGVTDTVELNSFWAAALVQRVRSNGSAKISLHGILPTGSPESTPQNKHWACDQAPIESHVWESWMLGRPTL